MKSMRFAICVLLLSACADDEEQRINAQRYRAQVAADRQERWNSTYAPYIEAACREDDESVQCARAKLDSRRMFIEDEDRERRNVAQNTPRRVKCVTIGIITKCKER
jgi:hypothetical protein